MHEPILLLLVFDPCLGFENSRSPLILNFPDYATKVRGNSEYCYHLARSSLVEIFLCKDQQNYTTQSISLLMDPESWIINQFSKQDEGAFHFADFHENECVNHGYDEENEEEDTVMNQGGDDYVCVLDEDDESDKEINEDDEDVIPVPLCEEDEEDVHEPDALLTDEEDETFSDLEERPRGRKRKTTTTTTADQSKPKSKKRRGNGSSKPPKDTSQKKALKRKRAPRKKPSQKSQAPQVQSIVTQTQNLELKSDPPTNPSPTPPRKRRRTKKELNLPLTLQNYEQRLRSEGRDLIELDNAYLTDFDLTKILKTTNGHFVHHAQILDQLAKQYKVKVRGFLSENKRAGKYVDRLPNGEKRDSEGGGVRCVYVGNASPFTGHKDSPYRILKEDMVYN
jgi:hypothetical protein